MRMCGPHHMDMEEVERLKYFDSILQYDDGFKKDI